MAKIPISAVVFDLDGVIVDSEKVHEKAKRKTLARFGVNVPDGLFDMFMGRTDRHLFAYLRDIYGLTEQVTSNMYDFKQKAYSALRDELELIPGSLDCLNRLQETTRLALVTSASTSNQRISFDKFDLDRHFEFVLTQEDVAFPKPHPAPFLEAARRLDVVPEMILVIEDSPNGVKSAADAGCHVMGLTTNFPAPTLEGKGAHVVADNFNDVERLFQSRFDF